jgi:hypothetical protein
MRIAWSVAILVISILVQACKQHHLPDNARLINLGGAAPHAIAYADSSSGILFYVESDGRHIAAISAQGTILWCRDPFAEAGLEPYRYARPVISWIGRSNREPGHIGISYNSSQFGIADQKTGEFTFLGQD